MIAARTLVLPKLGLTMTEGTLVEWKVVPGQSFRAGETLCIVETEKITNDVEAPSAGIMTEHLVDAGTTVAAGAPVAHWRGEDGEVGSETQAGVSNTPVSAPTDVAPAPIQVARMPTVQSSAAHATQTRDAERSIATPLARKLAADRGIDLRRIQGSGPRGRIKSADLQPSDFESAVSDSRPAPLTFFLATQINARALTNLKKKVSLIDELKDVDMVHFAGLAAARVLYANPRFNRTWTDHGATQLLDAAIVMMTIPGGDIIVDKAGRKSLRDFVADAGDPRSAAAISVTATNSEHVTAMSLPLRPGRSLSVALGAVRTAFRGGANGEPVLAEELTVVVSCDLRVFDYAAGTEFLLALREYLESPLLILG